MERIFDQAGIDEVSEELLQEITPETDKATVIGLTGNLGAGKTTLVQSIARALSITERVISPTFVIAKFYSINNTENQNWQKLIHIDAYRIEDVVELETLDWQNMLKNSNTLIIVEWPERIEKILPKETQIFAIEHRDNSRLIKKIK